MSEDPGEALPAAIIAVGKITGYLLNPEHREGGSKARFFIACGFSPDEPNPFIEALLLHGEAGNLVRTTDSAFGVEYGCEGPLEAPRRVIRRVRSVWQRKPGEVWRFLVTAYPI